MTGRGLLGLLLLGLVSLVASGDVPRFDPKAAGLSSEKLALIEAMLQSAVEKKQIAGGSALVARNGKIVYLAAVGHADTENNVLMADDTIFRVASMTKPITSVAVMILHDDQKLSVHDPLSKYIPEFAGARVLVKGEIVPASRPINIHDLLTHTSGIAYRFSNRPGVIDYQNEFAVSDGIVETPISLAENARRTAKVPLALQPGSGWEYGLNADILGRVVEVASGMPFDEFVQKRIFTPLKMTDAHFIVPLQKRSRLAALYTPKVGGLRRLGSEPAVIGTLVYSATYPFADENVHPYRSGGAGLSCTISDYYRFLQMMLNKGELDGKRILKPETVELMLRDHISPHRVPFSGHGDGFGYGFGIMTSRGKALMPDDPLSEGAFSWGGLFYTYFFADPKEQLIAILMTQVHPSGQAKLREGLKTVAYGAIEK